MEFIVLASLTAVPSYVLGSINGAIIASSILYRKDIRDYGSGNAGLTNFYRVFGKSGSALVLFIDVMKTILPVLFGGWLFARYYEMFSPDQFPFDKLASQVFFGQALAGLAVILGHCFPVFYKFRGGKGVMAIGALVIMADWRLALIAWGIFILIIVLTRYVSLGSIIGSASIPVSMMLLKIGSGAELAVIILCVLIIISRHTENIKRIKNGEESKFAIRRKSGQEDINSGGEGNA